MSVLTYLEFPSSDNLKIVSIGSPCFYKNFIKPGGARNEVWLLESRINYPFISLDTIIIQMNYHFFT